MRNQAERNLRHDVNSVKRCPHRESCSEMFRLVRVRMRVMRWIPSSRTGVWLVHPGTMDNGEENSRFKVQNGAVRFSSARQRLSDEHGKLMPHVASGADFLRNDIRF